jgi:hypothetical protein
VVDGVKLAAIPKDEDLVRQVEVDAGIGGGRIRCVLCDWDFSPLGGILFGNMKGFAAWSRVWEAGAGAERGEGGGGVVEVGKGRGQADGEPVIFGATPGAEGVHSAGKMGGVAGFSCRRVIPCGDAGPVVMRSEADARIWWAHVTLLGGDLGRLILGPKPAENP